MKPSTSSSKIALYFVIILPENHLPMGSDKLKILHCTTHTSIPIKYTHVTSFLCITFHFLSFMPKVPVFPKLDQENSQA